MSLRKKTILTIILTFLCVMIAGGVFAQIYFMESFRSLELDEVREEAVRFHYLLDRELENLSVLTNDWAAWDDTYDFVQTGSQEYIESNLVDSTFEELNLDFAVYVNDNNDVVYETAYDNQNQERMSIKDELRFFFLDQAILANQGEVSGYYTDDGRLILFSANQILTSLDEGPIRGILIFGKFFEDDLADHLALSLTSEFSLVPYSNNELLNRNLINGNPDIYYDDSSPEFIRFSSVINDRNGGSLFVVEQVLPRTIYRRGLASMRDLLIAVASAGLIASAISILALEKGFLSRLLKLSGGLRRYENGQENGDDLLLPGNDELTDLSRVIHQTLSNLSETQKDLGQHLDLEKLLVSTSSKFINLPLEKLDEGIDQVLEVIGKYSNVDRSYVLMMRESQRFIMDNTHEWCSPGTKSVISEMQNVDVRQFQWWFNQMRSGKSVFIDDVLKMPKTAQAEKAIFLDQLIKSIAIIPLFVAGKLVGFLGFDAVRNQVEWTHQTSILLEVVGSIITNALDRRRHETDLLLSHAQQLRLNKITQESIRKSDFESTCRSISLRIKSLINADNGILILNSNRKILFTFLSGRRVKISEANRNLFFDLVEHTGDKTSVFQKAKTLQESSDFRILGSSLLAIPLKTRNKTLGIIVLAFDEKHEFSKSEKTICEQAAPLVTLAIVKNRALETARRRSEELGALRATIADITSELEIEKLLQTILERAVKLLNADGGDFCVFDENEQALRVVALSNMDNKYLNTLINLNEGGAGKAASEKKTIFIEDYSNWESKLKTFEEANLRSAMVSPLMIGDRLMGTVGMFHTTSTKTFSENDRHLLSLFAQHASIALDNAMLFEKIQELARIDEITGLLNRRSFMERAEYEINRARRLNHSLALAMIDIDNFKHINDTFGHQSGDEVLKEVSRILRENIRNIDIIGRYGGDETVVLMPETTAESALNAMQRLRQILSDHNFKDHGQDFRITASIGLAAYPQASSSLEEMMSAADEAMYRAKKNGKNQVCIS